MPYLDSVEGRRVFTERQHQLNRILKLAEKAGLEVKVHETNASHRLQYTVCHQSGMAIAANLDTEECVIGFLWGYRFGLNAGRLDGGQGK